MRIASAANWLIVLLTAAGLQAADQDKDAKFTPGPASSYPARQTIDQVTIGAAPYLNDDETRPVFGKKLNPNKHGVLPILVVIENGKGGALFLENLKVELIDTDRRRIEATPASDLKYLSAGDRPKVSTGPIPGTQKISKKKSPFAEWTIEGRAFAARMLPPKETASGFVYFRAPFRSGLTLYITGIREAGTGKELFYFEIPLDSEASLNEAPGQQQPRGERVIWGRGAPAHPLPPRLP